MLLPFFVTFVLRTVAWQFLLGDQGLVLSWLKDAGIVGQNFHVLATVDRRSSPAWSTTTCRSCCCRSTSRWSGSTRSLLEAADDLYATRRQTFLRIVFPLTVPGIFAGVLLTFVPVAVGLRQRARSSAAPARR